MKAKGDILIYDFIEFVKKGIKFRCFKSHSFFKNI